MTARLYRESILRVVPSWLRGPVAGAVLRAIGEQLDELELRAVGAVKIRYPGLYSSTSLSALGRERRIRRGHGDSDESYALRLRRWRDDHRGRGGPYALLRQLYAHFAPDNFPIGLRYASGRTFAMAPDGTITRASTTPESGPQWARWWLEYAWPHELTADGTWDDPGTWDDGGVWDSGLAPAEVRDLRLVPREWGAAHAIGHVVLETPDLTLTLALDVA
jgi:hypothetical protein